VAGPLRGIFDLARVVRATRYSLAGLRAAIANEAAFRQELALFLVLAPLALWLGRNGIERALLLGSLMLVLIVELLNSAIETLVNRIGSERHELSGIAKDIASAAVFVALMQVPVVWALILIPSYFASA
jgi:diacylglycerol kinase (ATP)